MKSIGVGLVGWGTVGSGVIRVLRENAGAIEDRLGFALDLRKIADIDITRERAVQVPRELLTTRWEDVLEDPSIDIVIELIGGTTHARTVIERSLAAGKHVVTANKALLAHAGNELFEAARRAGRSIGFEASVCGGIPLLKSLREGLAGNRVDTVYGILNGTANYILTRMTEEGLSFEAALDGARAMGYAEADPTLDIEGIDTAHKLAILSAMAFGTPIRFDDVYTEGITKVEPLDIRFAGEFGYRVKLLAIARFDDGRVETRVHPTLVPQTHVLSSVTEAYNAVHIHGNAVGNIMLYGLGAGMMPTGSAVVADIMDIARCVAGCVPCCIPPLSFLPERLRDLPQKPMADVRACYYFRFAALDRPGVLSRISGILGKHDISISAVIQKGRGEAGAVPIVMITHEALERHVREALEEIDRLDVLRAPTRLIRIESALEAAR